jgi:hypothetical protein
MRGRVRADHDDSYSTADETNLFDAYFARPAMLGLVGGLEPAMVGLARQRLGEDADLQVADLKSVVPSGPRPQRSSPWRTRGGSLPPDRGSAPD